MQRQFSQRTRFSRNRERGDLAEGRPTLIYGVSDISKIPETIETKAAESSINIAIEQWKKLTPLQRFALIKLSRASHENKNFYPAVQEFGLV